MSFLLVVHNLPAGCNHLCYTIQDENNAIDYIRPWEGTNMSSDLEGESPGMSSNLAFENTDTILVEDRVFVPSSEVVNTANITAYMKSKGFDNYEDFYQWSLAHRSEYWDDQAKELHWFEPWQTTFEWTNKPFFKWFTGGKFNIVYNCLDRHGCALFFCRKQDRKEKGW